MRILDGPEYMCGRWYRIVSAVETLKSPRSATIEMVTIEIDAFASFFRALRKNYFAYQYNSFCFFTAIQVSLNFKRVSEQAPRGMR